MNDIKELAVNIDDAIQRDPAVHSIVSQSVKFFRGEIVEKLRDLEPVVREIRWQFDPVADPTNLHVRYHESDSYGERGVRLNVAISDLKLDWQRRHFLYDLMQSVLSQKSAVVGERVDQILQQLEREEEHAQPHGA